MGLLPGLPQGKPTGNAAPEAAQEGAPPAPDQFVDDEESNVSPEEQAEYEQVMNNALTLMYTEEGARPEVLEQLSAAKGGAPAPAEGEAPAEGAPPAEGGNAPVLALAQGAVTIVGQLDDSARQAGKPISDEVLYHAGLGVIEELAEIADAAGIYDYTEQDMTGAFAQALDMYRDKAIADGRTSKETLEAQFKEVNEAEAAGKLGDVLPGLGDQTVGEPPVQPEA